MADEIKVKITGDYDDKEAKQAIKDAEKIEDAKPELAITADASAAVSEIAQAETKVEALTDDDRTVIITAKIEDLKSQLQQAETDLKNLDTAATTTGDKISSEIGDGAGEARGRVSELVGESVAELPGIGTALGPAAEAMSSLTESALAGEIAIGSLVTAVGGMAAATVAFKLISGALADIAATDALKLQKVEDWVDALKSGEDVIDSMVAKSTKTGEILEPLFNGTKDLTPALDALGLTAEDFFEMVEGGSNQLADFFTAAHHGKGDVETLAAVIRSGTTDQEAWSTAMRDAGIKNSDLTDIVQGATLEMKSQGKAAEEAAVFNRVYGTAVADAAREHRGLTQTVIDGSVALEGVDTSARKAAAGVKSFQTNTAKADLSYQALMGTLDEQEAWENVNEAIDEFGKKTKHTDEEVRNHIQTIADYVVETDTIPASKKTEILAELREGDIEAAETALEELTRQRDIIILLKAVGSKDTIKLLTRGIGGGGFVDEAEVVGTSASVSSFAAAPQTVNVNLPRGARAGDITKAVGVSARRNGTLFANPVVTYAK